jgi:hypothetical protein
MTDKAQETFTRLVESLPAYERGLLNQEGRKNQALSAFQGRTFYLFNTDGGLVLQLEVSDYVATPDGAHAELTAQEGSQWYVTHRPSDVFGMGTLMWLPVHGRLQYTYSRGKLSAGFSVIASTSPGWTVEDHTVYMRRHA